MYYSMKISSKPRARLIHEATIKLRDNSEAFIRPIRPDDELFMKDMFYSFSEQTVYLRYHGILRSMPHHRLQLFCNIDYSTEKADKKKRGAQWAEAKRLCRLNAETLRMAKELSLNPRSLIKIYPVEVKKSASPGTDGTRLFAALDPLDARVQACEALDSHLGQKTHCDQAFHRFVPVWILEYAVVVVQADGVANQLRQPP